VCGLQNMVPDISAIESLFNLPGSNSVCALNDTLNFVRKLIMERTAEFAVWKSSIQTKSLTNETETEYEGQNIAVSMESLVEEVLLVVQTLVKCHNKKEGDKHQEDEENMENSESQKSTYELLHILYAPCKVFFFFNFINVIIKLSSF